MESIKYSLSKKQIRMSKFKVIALSSVFVFFGILFLHSAIKELSWEVLLALPCFHMAYQMFKGLKALQASDQVFLNITQESISSSGLGCDANILIQDIDSVVLQLIHGKPKSIVVHSSGHVIDKYGSDIIKIEGFQDMTDIANHIERLVGADKIRTAKFFHR